MATTKKRCFGTSGRILVKTTTTAKTETRVLVELQRMETRISLTLDGIAGIAGISFANRQGRIQDYVFTFTIG